MLANGGLGDAIVYDLLFAFVQVFFGGGFDVLLEVGFLDTEHGGVDRGGDGDFGSFFADFVGGGDGRFGGGEGFGEGMVAFFVEFFPEVFGGVSVAAFGDFLFGTVDILLADDFDHSASTTQKGR